MNTPTYRALLFNRGAGAHPFEESICAEHAIMFGREMQVHRLRVTDKPCYVCATADMGRDFSVQTAIIQVSPNTTLVLVMVENWQLLAYESGGIALDMNTTDARVNTRRIRTVTEVLRKFGHLPEVLTFLELTDDGWRQWIEWED